MLIGMTVPNAGPLARGATVVTIAADAEAAGFDSVWVADHVIVPHVSSQDYPYTAGQGVALPPTHPFLDPLLALAAIAGRTTRVLLCTGVYLLPLRHPLISAKAIASLDQLSGGRVRLGIGLGWIREEYDALGLPWERRGRMFDEAIDYHRTLWSEEAPTFSGETWQVSGIGYEPKPHAGTVPLLIGGLNQAARRRAATRGDGWHLIDVEPDAIGPMIAALAEDCAAAGRDPAAVPVSIYLSTIVTEHEVSPADRRVPLMGTPAQIVERLIAYRAAGVSHVALAARGLTSIEAYREMIDATAGHILPELRR